MLISLDLNIVSEIKIKLHYNEGECPLKISCTLRILLIQLETFNWIFKDIPFSTLFVYVNFNVFGLHV